MKRIQIRLVAIALFCACSPLARAGMYGDVDWNGAVNAVDVQMTINSALDLPIDGNADFNGDGATTAVDVQIVINLALDIPMTESLADLTGATVVVREGTLPPAEAIASTVLTEEVAARTGLTWPVATVWPETGAVIAITSGAADPGWSQPLPSQTFSVLDGLGPEGHWLYVEPAQNGRAIVWIIGKDPRGALYGVGRFLRNMRWSAGTVELPAGTNLASAPQYPLRGHQIGYRNTANSYDAWDETQYEQYIRELVIFGANAIENIPFEANGSSPHFGDTPEQMAAKLSAICARYDVDYWVWTPAPDVTNPTARAAALAQHAALYRSCERLDGVFVPGGDPGSNAPQDLMPFLAEIAALLAQYHPNAGVWVSNQGFEPAQNDYFFNYLETQQPEWLAGVVFGPWAKMTAAEMRQRTPSQYPVRHYPDITHCVRCQYPIEKWDRAFAHTLGREPINPRPYATAQIHNAWAEQTIGFLAYSDGCHDDFNKMIWSMRGWDPRISVREMTQNYTNFFFGTELAVAAGKGILALEQNWIGAAAANTNIDETLAHWQTLEAKGAPKANGTPWRWNMLLLRAYYDAYIRARLLYESGLEDDVNQLLALAGVNGADTTMDNALARLALADANAPHPEWRARIVELCEALFTEIGFQTSTSAPYLASGLERGAVLDFVDHPLNNRWWLEDQFAAIRGLSSEPEKLTALETIRTWEDPGVGGFYADLGREGMQEQLLNEVPWAEDPGFVYSVQNEFAWNQFRQRLSMQDQAQTLFGTPLRMRFENLDPAALYRLRVLYTGRFRPTMRLTANGSYLIHGDLTQPQPPQILEFDLPGSLTNGGTLELRWDLVNQRGCQVGEVWLVRR